MSSVLVSDRRKKPLSYDPNGPRFFVTRFDHGWFISLDGQWAHVRLTPELARELIKKLEPLAGEKTDD